VEDVVQDVFSAVLAGVAGLRDRTRIRSWLHTLTIRLCADRVRRLQRRRRLFAPLDLEAEAIAPGATPEQTALLSLAWRALDGISAPQRRAWSLRVIDGEPLREVARLCGCSQTTACRRIASATQAIERQLGGRPPRPQAKHV
jgi:RNA polymerase sigma-70 factor (ECF subfamily)